MCALRLLLVSAVLFWSVSVAVVPLPPSRNSPKQLAADCNGVLAFSATGSGPVHSSGIVAYKNGVVNLASTWDRELGVFTVACSGVYQFSFSGATDRNARLVLQKRLTNGKQWLPILATANGGGSATTLVEVSYGDQIAVFMFGTPKKFNSELEQLADVTSFNAYRIAKI
ncbi:uncharacterized protein LOC126833548 [Adelges cooleyi]|uniref:uncharacterized protein LOC126833548 n=1 Tax=Adelges cooleyi TaxID=133065 RepID=UPI002180460C|nr:uncharacterized protein LOC126833548 [Adelges cooleyi]